MNIDTLNRYVYICHVLYVRKCIFTCVGCYWLLPINVILICLIMLCQNGNTALTNAARRGYMDVVQYLVSHAQAEVNTVSKVCCVIFWAPVCVINSSSFDVLSMVKWQFTSHRIMVM